MSEKILIENATIVNEGKCYTGSVLIKDQTIDKIIKDRTQLSENNINKTIDAKGKILIPGVIDDQVHFREPGLIYKGDIHSESKAAIAGGITSFMEMPNTIPQTINQHELELKYELALKVSPANFSFYIGATNDNIEELLKTDPKNVCGVKVFMGSSTGNMLVDNIDSLRKIFSQVKLPVAVHCEDEEIIKQNIKLFKNKYGENIPLKYHPAIRSEEACYKSSFLATELAKKYGTRLHILHLSTQKELELLRNNIPLKDKKITAEVCIHHLCFDEGDYERLGSLIKWNPAIKKKNDRLGLLDAIKNNTIDVVATDHAPHTLDEKNKSYFKCPSGGPLVQHALVAMLEFYHSEKLSLEKIVEKMCHTPADIFQVEKRGYIREGYYADIVLLDLQSSWKVTQDNILYKCKWSPFIDREFQSKVSHTFVNGNLVYENGKINDSIKGMRLSFTR